MPASLDHIDASTPMGANLIADGATFRVWAPNALAVHVLGEFNGRRRNDASLLTRDGDGHWRGFVRGVKDRQRHRFHVTGRGGAGPKRDPCARELEAPVPGECVVRSSTDFAWHETGWRPPPFHEFVIYQLHVGTFFTPHLPAGGKFLDVALKVPYLAELGVTVLQLLPIQEFQTPFSLGYNGTDYFSPEMDYGVADARLAPYRTQLNRLLKARGLAPYPARALRGEMNQLKALVDLCHAHGLAVMAWPCCSIWSTTTPAAISATRACIILDRQPAEGGNRNSLYFSDVGHAGGLLSDFGRPEVRDFLICNACFFLDDYRIDGFRYDQVSVIDHDGAPHGWRFCQDLTSTLRFRRPEALQLAEYWSVNHWVVEPPSAGAGFDSTLTDGLRIALREVIAEASRPHDGPLPMTRLAQSLWPEGFCAGWRFVQEPENHDIVYRDRQPRIARLGQPDAPRSWFARSRARVATGLSLTAPGIPMLFMGQEFLEDKPWADDLQHHAALLLHWAGLDQGDQQMLDHLRFTRELLQLRRRLPALRGGGFRVVHAHDGERMLAFHRWVEGEGSDVLVVVHLGNRVRGGCRIGFPGSGRWREVFNSDVYETWVNPNVAGNGGSIQAEDWPMHGLDASAALVAPANGLLVFAR